MNIVRTIKNDYVEQYPTVLELVDAHSHYVYKLCRSLAYSKEEADDLFQETFLKVVEQQEVVRKSEYPQKFIYSITLYLWKSWKRKHARRNRIASMEPLEETIVSFANIEETVIKQEETRIIVTFVNQLPERFRVPVILHYIVEVPIPDIALILKLPVGTVKSRLHKARKLIKKELEVIHYEVRG